MNAAIPSTSLELIRQVLTQYVDVSDDQIVPEAELAALNVDSLTLAELLFELDDRTGVQIPEPQERPKLVADLLRLVEPHMAQIQAKVQGVA